MRTCLDCGTSLTPGSRSGRGLCKTCYRWNHYHGTHIDYPLRTWRRDDLFEEWAALGYGTTRQERRRLAHRLGMTLTAVERAWYRARQQQREVAS